MLDGTCPPDIEMVFLQAREAAPREALLGFGHYVTGRRAYVATGTTVLHGREIGAEIVHVLRPWETVPVETALDDPGLDPLGLGLSRVAASPARTRCLHRVRAGVVALRLGLLAQCLDRAYGYLHGRESFGQKLLHHQLIKARFARTHATLSRLLEELAVAGANLSDVIAYAMHAAISQEFIQAAKLMGGHGFTNGGTHELEYVASLCLAVHGPVLTRRLPVDDQAIEA